MNEKEMLLKAAYDAVTGCALMNGRTKATTAEVAGKALTMIDYEAAQAVDDNGEVKDYFVVIFKEMPDKYYGAGKALGGIIENIEAAGLHDALKIHGLLIQLTEGRTKRGRSYTTVKMLE